MRATVSTFIMLLVTMTALADPSREALLLPDGAYGTTVQGGLAEGETRAYTISAKKGQQFKARLVSLEDNGFLLITDSQGHPLLNNLPENARVRSLDLILPRTGKYSLKVAAKEGQCSYLLEVTLDDPPPPNPKNPKQIDQD